MKLDPDRSFVFFTIDNIIGLDELSKIEKVGLDELRDFRDNFRQYLVLNDSYRLPVEMARFYFRNAENIPVIGTRARFEHLDNISIPVVNRYRKKRIFVQQIVPQRYLLDMIFIFKDERAGEFSMRVCNDLEDEKRSIEIIGRYRPNGGESTVATLERAIWYSGNNLSENVINQKVFPIGVDTLRY